VAEFRDFCGFPVRVIAVLGVRLPALLQKLRGVAAVLNSPPATQNYGENHQNIEKTRDFVSFLTDLGGINPDNSRPGSRAVASCKEASVPGGRNQRAHRRASAPLLMDSVRSARTEAAKQGR